MTKILAITTITSIIAIMGMSVVTPAILPNAFALDDDPIVDIVSWDSGPSPPSGWKVACLDNFGVFSPTCPVLKWDDVTYWTYSDINNRVKLNVVAYDESNNILDNIIIPDIRYTHSITVNPDSETVTFTAQGNSTGVLTYEELFQGQPVPVVQQVDIDIKPNSDRNNINCTNTRDTVTVAMFGSETFNVTTVDLQSLQLDGVDVTEKHDKLHVKDVNSDGINDVVLHLDKSKVCEATHDLPLRETVEVTLTGSSIDEYSIGEYSFEGIDNIRIVNR